jgi:hypothetical protein
VGGRSAQSVIQHVQDGYQGSATTKTHDCRYSAGSFLKQNGTDGHHIRVHYLPSSKLFQHVQVRKGDDLAHEDSRPQQLSPHYIDLHLT